MPAKTHAIEFLHQRTRPRESQLPIHRLAFSLEVRSRQGRRPARTILSHPEQNPPELILKAADILAHQAQTLPSEQTRRELQSLIPTLQDSILRLETSGEAEVHPDLLGKAFGLIQDCQRQIG